MLACRYANAGKEEDEPGFQSPRRHVFFALVANGVRPASARFIAPRCCLFFNACETMKIDKIPIMMRAVANVALVICGWKPCLSRESVRMSCWLKLRRAARAPLT